MGPARHRTILPNLGGLAVTDVFGHRQWVTPAGVGSDEDWQRWSPKVAVGPPLEEVLLIRDENANLVWGIEHTIRMPTGEPHRGSEASAEVLAYRRRRSGPPENHPAYNRSRWREGRVAVWLSAHRGEGRGEGSSGLAFDLLINKSTVPE